MPTNPSRRFTPASMHDFTVVARDVADAYGLKLSRAQENLARIYGFNNFHELRLAIDKSSPAGPYDGETDLATIFNRTQDWYLEDLSGYFCCPVGRRRLPDLKLFMRPDERRAWMRFQNSIDQELDANFSAEAATVSVDNYVSFVVDHIDQLGEKWIEGKFVQTALGRQVWEALVWIIKDEEDVRDPEERSRMFDGLNRIMDNHPNNPYPGALIVGLVASRFEESWGRMLTEEIDIPEEDMACALWLCDIAKQSIDLFQSTVPKNFRGTIEPKLVGHWIENYSYHSVLHCGGIAAATAGKTKQAMQWFRRSISTCKNDPFGSRFWL